MSLHQTAPGKFTVQISKTDPLGEKNLRLCQRVEGLEAARKQEAAFRAEANEWASRRALMKQATDRGIQIVRPSIPSSSSGFADFLEAVYLPWAKVHHDPRTLAARSGTLTILALDLGNTPLAEVENHVDDLVVKWRAEGCRFTVERDRLGRVLNRKARPISDAGLNERIKLLRAVLNHAHRQSRVLAVAPRISLIKVKRAAPGAGTPVAYFTPEQGARFLRYSSKGVDDVFYLGTLTGMRPGELFHLRVGAVEFRLNLITVQACECPLCPQGRWVPKVGAFRTIPIAPDLLPILRRLCRKKPDSAHVIENTHGRPYIALPGSGGRFVRTLKRAGLAHLSGYAMRHTAAAQLASAGWNAKDISVILGNTERTVQIAYSHLMPGRTAQAIKSLKAVKPWPEATVPKPALAAVADSSPAAVTSVDDHAA